MTISPRRQAPVFWLLGVLALLATGAAGTQFVLRSPAGASPSAEGRDGSPADDWHDQVVVCRGYVDAESGVRLIFPTQPGRVAKVLVKESHGEIEAGTALIEMEDEVARSQVEAAEANLAKAKDARRYAEELRDAHPLRVIQQEAAIKGARSRLEAARIESERKHQLVGMKLLNSAEARGAAQQVKGCEAGVTAAETKLRELKLLDPDIDVSRAQRDVDAAEAMLKKGRKALKECRLEAPLRGSVLRVYAKPGDVVGPQSSEPALSFCPSGPRVIRAEVDQEFAGRVAVGQVATIQDDTTSQGNWRGKVVYVSDWFAHRRRVLPEPQQQQDVRTLECIIDLDPEQPALRINQRVRVTLGP